MDAELKAKWVKALRGKKYKQGTACLYDGLNNTYCCLGVLCDLVDPKGWGEPDEDNGYIWNWHGDRDEIPTKLRRPLKLTPTKQSALISMNDVQRKTFPEIADYIEAKL